MTTHRGGKRYFQARNQQPWAKQTVAGGSRLQQWEGSCGLAVIHLPAFRDAQPLQASLDAYPANTPLQPAEGALGCR